MQNKKIPMRQCGGCKEMKPKKELVRVVKTPEGEILLDTVGRKNGRGSYICKNVDCFSLAIKRKSFERAFGAKIPEDVAENILKELNSED